MQIIEHIELASAQSSITFSSIPGDYTDLYLVLSTRNDTNGALQLTFNSNTANYSGRRLYGSGSAVNTSSNPSGTSALFLGDSDGPSQTSNTFGSLAIYIPNYAGSVAKSVSVETVSENNATQAFQHIIAGLWNDTTAISSIQITGYAGGNFVQYSSATLYGITAGSDGSTTVS